MEFAIHPTAKRQLEALFENAPQSVMLTGSYGVGLATIAAHFVENHTAIWLRPQNKKEEVDYKKGSITVEMIRRLYDQTRSKREGKLFVVIDNADTMTRSAQAAFLKLLEEPGESIHFILLAHNPDRLATTIRSRVQQCHVRPITEEESAAFIKSLGITDDKTKAQLLFIAAGLPAELTRLAGDKEYFAAQAALTTDARDLLTASTYDRLRIIAKYQANRDQALGLIDRALALARRTMSANPQTALLAQLDGLLEARANIAGNQSARLQLAQFVL